MSSDEERIERRLERIERKLDGLKLNYEEIRDAISAKKVEAKIPNRDTKFYDYLMMIFDEAGDRTFTSRGLLKSGFKKEDLYLVSHLNVHYRVFDNFEKRDRCRVRRIKPEVCKRLSEDLPS